MNNYEFINYINAKLICENTYNANYFVNIGPLFGYKDDCSLYLMLNDKLKKQYEGNEVYTLINSLNKDNWFEILYNGLDTYKPGEDYKLSESLYNKIQQEINNKNNITNQSPTFNNDIHNENIEGFINCNVDIVTNEIYNGKEYELNITLENTNNCIGYVTFEILDTAIIKDNLDNRVLVESNYITKNGSTGILLNNELEYNYNILFTLPGLYNYQIKVCNAVTHEVIGYKYGEFNVLDNGNKENYVLPNYIYYTKEYGIEPNTVDWSRMSNDSNSSLVNIEYYEKLNKINNSQFTKDELDNFYITFCKFILDNTMLDIYTENNYIYLSVLQYYANGKTDYAQTGLITMLNSAYGAVTTNTYSSCGCNNNKSTSNDKTCVDLYKDAMTERLKIMLGDIKFYEDWLYLNNTEYNKVIVDGLITLIDEFLSLNYSLNFDKSKMSKCNCDSITEPNNCNIRIIEDYKQVLNWIKNNKTEENTNKIKICGSSFGELLPNLQF
jgi:hypothetical protein